MGHYGNAQICLNGHVITSIGGDPQFLKKFCPDCGAATIMNCLHCNTPIKGLYVGDSFGLPEYNKPSFCDNCGLTYPWTQSSKDAASQLIDFAEQLNQQEKDDLKLSIDDLIKDTPKTALAQVKFKKYALKAGGEIAKGLKDILIDLVSETVKKSIWNS